MIHSKELFEQIREPKMVIFDNVLYTEKEFTDSIKTIENGFEN